MAWTSPRTWVAGEKPSAATFNTHVRDDLKAIGDAWTSYGSGASWTASTTNPTLGNGTWSGAYIQPGKLVVGRFVITLGSTTTVGSGNYRVALPVTAASSGFVVGSAHFNDASATQHYGGWVLYLLSTGLMQIVQSGTGGLMSNASPVVPANGDVIDGTFTYEAA